MRALSWIAMLILSADALHPQTLRVDVTVSPEDMLLAPDSWGNELYAARRVIGTENLHWAPIEAVADADDAVELWRNQAIDSLTVSLPPCKAPRFCIDIVRAFAVVNGERVDGLLAECLIESDEDIATLLLCEPLIYPGPNSIWIRVSPVQHGWQVVPSYQAVYRELLRSMEVELRVRVSGIGRDRADHVLDETLSGMPFDLRLERLGQVRLGTSGMRVSSILAGSWRENIRSFASLELSEGSTLLWINLSVLVNNLNTTNTKDWHQPNQGLLGIYQDSLYTQARRRLEATCSTTRWEDDYTVVCGP